MRKPAIRSERQTRQVMTATLPRKSVHAFPARMAPEIALEKIELLTEPGGTVLDPMCGSGTVIRLAGEADRRAIGVDVDPLAVMITRTACHRSWTSNLAARAEAVLERAFRLRQKLPDWIRRDQETNDFIDYWFAPTQIADLSRIARILIDGPRKDDPLRVALSRMIVTKEMAASLARDTSHSRPHRVADDNDYDVFSGFLKSAEKLEGLMDDARGQRRPSIRRADARTLGFVPAASVDLCVTSPPYLNAIDYLRGHKMSLVWLGWTVGALREIRAGSVGVERGLEGVNPEVNEIARAAVPCMSELPRARQGMVLHFTHDMNRLTRSLARVTKRGGHLVMVVADSQLKGVPISNATICRRTAGRNGFELIEEKPRPLPAQHRYLPPPTNTTGTLATRMKDEIVFTFARL
jgi:SAM-dependent methyltransferase